MPDPMMPIGAGLIAVGPAPPMFHHDVLMLLQSPAEEASAGKVQGLAICAMRERGNV